MKTPIGIYIDVFGKVNEFFGETKNINLEQKNGFVQVNILEARNSREFEITESYVLYEVVRTLKNNKGFGLIETMMALGLMSLGFLAFGQIMTNMSLSQNWSDFRLSTNALASSMIGSLNSPATCTQGFTGMSFVPTGNPVPVSFSLPNKTLSAGTVVPNYNLSITTLNYINYRPVQTNLDGSVTYFGDLSMTTKASKRVLGPNMSTVTVDSIYMTVLGGLIINCGNVSPTPNPTPVPSPSPTPEATPMPSPVPTYTYTPPGDHEHDEPCDHDGR